MSEVVEELSDYELLRKRNIEENIQKMKELGIFKELNKTQSEHLQTRPKIRRTLSNGAMSRRKDRTLERRRSLRLVSRLVVQFSDDVSRQILGNTDSCSVSWADENDYYGKDSSSSLDENLEWKRKPGRKKISVTSSCTNRDREIISVDKITEDDLKRIARHVRDKIYSQNGTTCHQCRQKTEDQKTVCRSSECFGVRGQFCGPCLRNRYGESVATALKDPEWVCPPCRDMCNCSICRNHAGKIPTGQLYCFAQKRGYDSVKHLLDDEDEN